MGNGQCAVSPSAGGPRSNVVQADDLHMDTAHCILSFCTWTSRAEAAALSAACRAASGLEPHPRRGESRAAEECYWRFLCERVAEEHQLHVPQPAGGPQPPPGVAATWRELFAELSPLVRAEISGKSGSPHDAADTEAFNVKVAARFRPAQSLLASEEPGLVLPLHQKVQLLRRQLGCDAKAALALIMRERMGHVSGEGAGFQPCLCPSGDNKENVPSEPGTHSTGKAADGADEPPPKDALAAMDSSDARCSILSVNEDTASVLAMTRQSGLREFAFDRVFKEGSRQSDVYERTARRLVMEFLNGRSASVICYGQTASGKTFTMFGPPGCAAARDTADLQGLVPRACAEVLGAVQRWRARGSEAHLGVSYVELFGSEISDLLRSGGVVGQGQDGRYSAVRATDRVGHRYVLDGNTEFAVESLEEVLEFLRIGDESKRLAATAMNERSTRAHAVFVLNLSVAGSAGCEPRRSRFYFADLGGSEKLTKSKADAGTKAPVTVVGGEEVSRLSWREYYAQRQRVQETANINMGLFALKRVIEALHRRTKLAQDGERHHLLPYVPYQDSKLTMLLQEALGGSARTLVVATVATDPQHGAESLQTVRFADTCAQVQKQGEVDEAASVRVALGHIAEEIERLQEDIRRKERWETRLVRREDKDTVAGAFGEGQVVLRQELVHKSVLVGAEAERVQLELLLQQQTDLQGLSGGSGQGQDYRALQETASEAKDGGRGTDFRSRDRFSARTKAKDFEQESVVADAVRFFFRKAPSAAVAFGETERSARRRLASNMMPAGYLRVAKTLRLVWEESSATGAESRSFGKAILDRCQAWAASFRDAPDAREGALLRLLEECSYVPTQDDLLHMTHPVITLGALAEVDSEDEDLEVAEIADVHS